MDEKALRTLEDGCALTLASLDQAIRENKDRGGLIDCAHAPLVRDLAISYEKILKAKSLLREEEQGGSIMRGYGARYMDSGENGSFSRRNPATGRYMDAGPGVYGDGYGHGDQEATLHRLINNARDPEEKHALEEALRALQQR